MRCATCGVVSRSMQLQGVAQVSPSQLGIDALMNHIERNVLPQKFGHTSFRSGQREVIQSLLSGKSCLAVLPTGAGKSLLYMLPSQLLEGVTVVVSPLLALMRDQVEALREQNITAARIDSSMTMEQVRQSVRDIVSGKVKVLYVSPERFNNEAFKRLLSSIKVAMFVVDEVRAFIHPSIPCLFSPPPPSQPHNNPTSPPPPQSQQQAHCISEWGHAFRPDYLRLAYFASMSNAGVRLALTATATSRVADDILDKLEIKRQDVVRLPSLRKNIQLSVESFKWPDDGYEPRLECLLRFLRRHERLGGQGGGFGACIVYVSRQKLAERLAADLLAMGLDARPYHAGMRSEERLAVENWFLGRGDSMEQGRGQGRGRPACEYSFNNTPLVVGTVAFGMGIDKSDIRGVIHFDLPRSVEDYVQGFGRAGRDGAPAQCLAMLAERDAPGLRSQICGSTPSLGALQAVLQVLFEAGAGAGAGVGAVTEEASDQPPVKTRSRPSLNPRALTLASSSTSSSSSATLPRSGRLCSNTVDDALFVNFYDLANAFDVAELPLRLALAHLVTLGVVSELTPVYGSRKLGVVDRAKLSDLPLVLASWSEAEMDADWEAGPVDGAGEEPEAEVVDASSLPAVSADTLPAPSPLVPSSVPAASVQRWLGLCKQIATVLEEATGSATSPGDSASPAARGRKRKWQTVDTIALASRLAVPPSDIIFATSLLCRARVCADGGLTRVYSRYRLLRQELYGASPAELGGFANKLHGHAMEIQRRSLARVDEIAALLGRNAGAGGGGADGGLTEGEAIWMQIAEYFEEDSGKAASTRVATSASTAPLYSILPFDSAGWGQVESLVLSGAIPADDPALIARFAAGVLTPRIVKLKLSRATAFGAAASSDWLALLSRSEALCRLIINNKNAEKKKEKKTEMTDIV